MERPTARANFRRDSSQGVVPGWCGPNCGGSIPGIAFIAAGPTMRGIPDHPVSTGDNLRQGAMMRLNVLLAEVHELIARVRQRIPAAAIPWLGLTLAVLLAGAASIALRQDSNWDLQNYHFYNAWAFVHDRFGIDWAPAQLQSFYSPFLDLPFYALVAADVAPRAIAFVLAIPTGVAWFFCARIAMLLFAGLPAAERTQAIVVAMTLGVTAPMSVSLIGLTMNDWYSAAFVMSALWLVVRDAELRPVPVMTLLAAGALVGAGAGLKLTGTIYAVGLVVGVLAFPGAARDRLRAAAITGAAAALTFTLASGPWMYLMYERYGNPLFPYFNQIFQSPWADPVTFSATRFGPRSAVEWLVFPFALLWKLEGYVSEAEFRDARPALLYTLALTTLCLGLWRRAESRVDAPKLIGATRAWRFLGAFFLASFTAWAVLYRIFRYLVPLELLAGMFIAYFVLRLVPARRIPAVLAVAVLLAITTARFPTWWRQKFEDHFLTVELPAVKPDALVLLVSAEPMSYVLPFFPSDARFAGLVSNFNDPDRTNLLQRKIVALIRGHRGSLYALAVPPGRDVGGDALAKMELQRESCQLIRTNLRVSPLELCELRRLRQE